MQPFVIDIVQSTIPPRLISGPETFLQLPIPDKIPLYLARANTAGHCPRGEKHEKDNEKNDVLGFLYISGDVASDFTFVNKLSGMCVRREVEHLEGEKDQDE